METGKINIGLGTIDLANVDESETVISLNNNVISISFKNGDNQLIKYQKTLPANTVLRFPQIVDKNLEVTQLTHLMIHQSH